MDIFLSRGTQDPEVRIRFPAEPDVVWPMLTELDEYCASDKPIRIVGTSSSIPNFAQYISCADVEQAADIRKLYVLAEMVDGLDTEKQRIFSDALDAKSVNGLDDVLRIADSLDSAVIKDVKIAYPWAHLLPTDSITLEDANTLAKCVLNMTPQGLRLFGGVLEVEEPRSFRESGTIAMDIDDYELTAGSEREYGLEALRYAGAGDEILELLEGFTDFDALGRSEMEADGVRETSFGHVRRLSAPWPEQGPEIGQTMC